MRSLWMSVFLLLGFSAYAQQRQPAVPGEFLIRFKSFAAAKRFYQNKANTMTGTHKYLKTRFAPIGFVKVSNRNELGKLSQNLKSSREIAYMEPNYIYALSPHQTREDMDFNRSVGNRSVPSDEFFSKLWGINNTKNAGIDINIMKSWNQTRRILKQEKIVIAVIDTGVDYTHPDLKENIWTNAKEIPGNGIDDDNNGYIDDIHGYDFANRDGDPMDDNDHGTHVSGTIGASHNSFGVAGVMSHVKIMGLKFLTGRGSGTLSDAVKAIDYATMMKVDVMSNSWGGGGYSKVMFEAIKRANDAGIVFVAAAGNSKQNNDRRPSYPATYQLPNVISVAAMDIKGNPASFTSYGAEKVHVAAPGVNILSTTKGGKYKSFSGTSMATPHVSGIVGVILATKGREIAPKMRELLIRSSKKKDSLSDISLSDGMVDTHAALTGQLSVLNR